MDLRCGGTFDENPHVCYYIKMMMADLTSGTDAWRKLLGLYNGFDCIDDHVCHHVGKNNLRKTVGDITCPDGPSGGPHSPHVKYNMHNLFGNII